MKNDRFLIGLLCFLVLAKRLMLVNFGLNYEEGKELESALHILNGKLIYRDFFWQYGPGPIYLIAFLYKIFGTVNLLIPRVLVSLVAALTTYFSFRVARFYLPSLWAFWAALLSSSGLAAREGTYGHGFAYLGMIASLYFLIRYFKNEGGPKSAALAGLFVSAALFGKPVVFGIGALVCGLTAMIVWSVLHKPKPPDRNPVFYFCVMGLAPSLLVFGYLLFQTPSEVLFSNLYPLSSGSHFIGAFHLKPLFPPFPSPPWSEWIGKMNFYLVDPLRWWTIILTSAGTLVFIARRVLGFGDKLNQHFFLGLLLVYALLIESETILFVNRPITFYVNMLPTYILLALFILWCKEKRWGAFWAKGLAAAFCLVYFFYPPTRLILYHWTHSKPLGLNHAETLRVPSYTREAYRNIADYVQRNTPPGRPILFAGYDGFVYLFSNRPKLFPEDFATFIRCSFGPSHKDLLPFPKSFYEGIEKRIVERIQSNPPTLILLPWDSITPQSLKESIFIKYLVQNWEWQETLNSDLNPGPFDNRNLKMAVYRIRKKIGLIHTSG